MVYYYNTVANTTQWERPEANAYDEASPSENLGSQNLGIDDSSEKFDSKYEGSDMRRGSGSDNELGTEKARQFRQSRGGGPRMNRLRARSELSNEIAQAEIALLRQKSPSPSPEPDSSSNEKVIRIQQALLERMRGPIAVLIFIWCKNCAGVLTGSV